MGRRSQILLSSFSCGALLLHRYLPHILKVIFGAGFGVHDMDDDVKYIYQHPLTGFLAFGLNALDSFLAQVTQQIFGYCVKVAARCAAGDYHEVGDLGLALEVYAYDFLGFAIFQ